MALVSVLVAAYKATYLEAALQSAVDQTHRQIEIVVVDDNPAAGVRAVVEQFGDSRIRYLENETSHGPAVSYARALTEASGAVVGILNDDDIWAPDLVQRLLEELDAWPEAVVAFADHWVMVDGETDQIQSDRCTQMWKRDRLAPGMHRPFQRLALIDKSIPLAVAALFRKDAVDPAQIRLEFGGMYDYFLSYLLTRGGAGAVYVPERLAAWRIHSRNLTRHASCARAEEGAAVMRIVSGDPLLAGLKTDLTAAYSTALWSVATRNLRLGSRRRAAQAAIGSVRHGHLKAMVLLPAAMLPRLLLTRWWPT